MYDITSITPIIFNILILGYVLYLEKEKCKCIMDWRHNFIKYYVLIIVLFPFIFKQITGNNIIKLMIKNNNHIQIGKISMSIVAIVYVYALVTYIIDLDKTQCACAIHDMKYLHKSFYNIPRFILYFALFGGIAFVAYLFIYNIYALFFED